LPNQRAQYPFSVFDRPGELAERIRIAEACRTVKKWKGRKPELVEKYLNVVFGR
jgi:hypothetical protein